MAKFKKLALVSSAVLMTTAFAFGVAACGEEACTHTYEKKSNETHTWYACTQEGCDSVVGKEEIHVHNYVKTNDETHTWYECDKEGCESVVAKEEIVTPHVHTFALKKNDTKHWYECSDTACAEKVGEMAHVWNEGEETLAPEVGVAGEYTYTCRVCGQTDVEEISALTPNPLIIAEGSAVGLNYQYKYVTLNLEAGDYVAITDNEDVTCDQFTVEETGEFEVPFNVFSFAVSGGAEVPFNYVIKKVPSITPDVSEMEGTVEIVAYAWVKVNVTIPVAGKFAIGSEDALFSESANGSESDFIYDFTTTEANETVTFYAKALDDSEEKATINYQVAQLEATELSKGANVVELWGFTATDVTFTAPDAGAYKFVTFDDEFAVYTNYEGQELCSKLNGIYYFEAEEAGQEFSFALSSYYDVAMFAIEEFPDEERYTSVVTFDYETGEGYANLKAGSTATFQLPMGGTCNFVWSNPGLVVSVNDVVATTQNVAFVCSMFNPLTVTVENTSTEDIEETFTMNNTISGSVEIYVPASSGSPMNTVAVDAKLNAGTYYASVSSTTITSAKYNSTALETTAVELTITENEYPDTLAILGANDTAEMVVVTFVKPGTAESPYEIAAAGQTFENVGAAVSTYNPMARADAYQIYFSYTATANGTLSWTFAETFPQYSVSNVEQSDGNWSDYNPYNNPYQFTVQAGITYTLTFEFLDMMGRGAPTTSPIFTFTAANV